MKIAYIYDAVYPWEMGGVQRRVWELARRLAADHDVHWYGLQYWDEPAEVEREGVTLHGVAKPRELYVDGRRSIPEALDFSAKLFTPLLQADVDVIDCQEFPYFTAFPSKLATIGRSTAFVMTWHEVWGKYWYDYLGWKGWFGKQTERVVSRLPDRHIAVSDRTNRDLESLGIRGTSVVPNGVSIRAIDEIDPATQRHDVLFVGRLIKEKNVELLVRAIATMRDTKPEISCLIIGEGPERERLQTEIDSLDLDATVTVSDFLESRDDVLATLKSARVLVLPSEREGFGMIALEALACGTPVVTVAHPSNAATELVDDGVTGVICEKSVEGIADGIRRARDCRSSDCRAAASEFDWDSIVDQVETEYIQSR